MIYNAIGSYNNDSGQPIRLQCLLHMTRAGEVEGPLFRNGDGNPVRMQGNLAIQGLVARLTLHAKDETHPPSEGQSHLQMILEHTPPTTRRDLVGSYAGVLRHTPDDTEGHHVELVLERQD